MKNLSNDLSFWKNKIDLWQKNYNCKTLPPVPKDVLENLEKQIGYIPKDLKDFYKVTNGLFCENFYILPIEDYQNIKKTWESINRANNQEMTPYLNANPDLLKKFIIFSDIGFLQACAFNRENNSIWFEEDGELYETNLNLGQFIEGMLAEK